MKLFKTQFFKNSRDEYESDFMSLVDRVCQIEEQFKKIEELSAGFLKDFIKSNRWEAAAKVSKNYGLELLTQASAGPFAAGAETLSQVAPIQNEGGAIITEKFNGKIHAFVQLEIKEAIDHLKNLEALRKEMEKTAKKAKDGDAVAKNAAAAAKENHDRSVPKVAATLTNFVKSAEMFGEVCQGWVEAETNMCNKTKEILKKIK